MRRLDLLKPHALLSPTHLPSTHLYMIMDKLELDVYEFVGRFAAGVTGGVGESVALMVIKSILSALKHCHALGYAHRDVKSENIMLNFSMDSTRGQPVVSQVRLIDFGMW